METFRDLSAALVFLIGLLGLVLVLLWLVVWAADRVTSLLRVKDAVIGYYRHRKEFHEWLESRKKPQ